MTDANKRIKGLIHRHLKGDLDIMEYDELQAWVGSSEENRSIFDQLLDPDQLAADLQEFHETHINILAKIDARMNQPAPPPADSNTPILQPFRIHAWRYAAAAAVVFLLTGIYLWAIHNKDSNLAKSQPAAGQDIAPGSNKAILTLGNGSNIILENTVNGSLSRQGNTTVVKNNDQLAYSVAKDGGKAPILSITYNTLTTPKAGQFQLILPDGTKVWLNNASSLRYPTSFTGSRREVQLSGEAYFEVASDPAQIFIVQVDGGPDVNVLGTSFNVMAYKDEAAIKTTLITGKVKLAQNGQESLLKPGEQALTDRRDGSHIIIKEADTEEAIAWKRGYFHFVHAGIGDVLRQLSRWYDVEVEFTIPAPDYTFDGEIDRKLSLVSILKHLEKKDLHFQVDGNKLIVFR